MKYLVDANVLSEATKPEPTLPVLDWLAKHEIDLAVNPIIVGELEYGILLLPAGKRRAQLVQWLADGVKHLPVIDIDEGTAHVWAQLLAGLKRVGRAMPVKDSLIAASAIQHRLMLATRNVNDYKHCGARLVNPFKMHRL